MYSTIKFDPDLIRRYDVVGPRYTSYPTAVQFNEGFQAPDLRAAVVRSNQEPMPSPLSVYVHVPFCSKLCFFCACNKVVTKRHERAEAYLPRLHRDIALHSALYDRDREVQQIHFGGGTPTFLHDSELAGILDVLSRHFKLAEFTNREQSIEVDPRTITRDRLQALRSMGFNRLSLGVQDFNPVVQKAVNRVHGEETVFELVSEARARGFASVNVDMIYGLPWQTAASFGETLATLVRLRPDRIALYNYAHLPHRFAPQRRIISTSLPSPAEKLQCLGDAIQRLTGAGYDYIGMDHFALPGDDLVQARRDNTLHRNFQGYSTHGDCDMVAVGLSAISDVGDAYSQNHKDINDYYAALDEAQLPILAGLTLSENDLCRRWVIQEIMCRDQVSFAHFERLFEHDFTRYFAHELAATRPMVEDGLIEVNECSLRILPMGRFMLRNIAMLFDEYMSAAIGRPRFSRAL